tara:strand:- start:5 stop:670 length:666 start_codon:yes stop_codon:yes gene_type:complete
MNNLLIIIIFMYSLSSCEESIYYTAKFKNINAGTAVLETKNNLNDNFIEINFSLKTRKMIDVFYKLRDDIHAFINPDDYSLIRIKKNSQQGKYSNTDDAVFDYDKKHLKYNDKLISINNKIYDPLSIIAFLRNQILFVGDRYQFSIYSKGEIKNINLEVLKQEIIKIKNRKYMSYVVGHNNNKSDIKFWIDQKPPFLPLIIETKSKNGDIILKYNSHQIND